VLRQGGQVALRRHERGHRGDERHPGRPRPEHRVEPAAGAPEKRVRIPQREQCIHARDHEDGRDGYGAERVAARCGERAHRLRHDEAHHDAERRDRAEHQAEVREEVRPARRAPELCPLGLAVGLGVGLHRADPLPRRRPRHRLRLARALEEHQQPEERTKQRRADEGVALRRQRRHLAPRRAGLLHELGPLAQLGGEARRKGRAPIGQPQRRVPALRKLQVVAHHQGREQQGRQGHGAPRGLLALEVAQEHRRAEGQRRHGDVRRHAEELHVVGLHREGNTRREEGREAHARLAPGVDLGRLLGVEARIVRPVGHPRGRRREAHEAEGNQARPREGGVGDVLEIPLEGLPLGGRRRAVARAEEVRVALQLEARGPHREHGHHGPGHRRAAAPNSRTRRASRVPRSIAASPTPPSTGTRPHKRARCRGYRQREACAADGHARKPRAVVATPQGHHEPRQGQRGRALGDAPAVHRARVEEHQRQRGVGDARVHGEATIARGCARAAMSDPSAARASQHGAGETAPQLRGVDRA
jgi:hypothetical protein